MMKRRQAMVKARDRLADAEVQAMMQIQSDEAKSALEAESALYREYLSHFEGISDRQRAFLVQLALNGMPFRACIEAGIPARTYYDWLKQNAEFKELTEECKKFSSDRLERTAIALANGEYMRPLVSQGRIAAYERIYDTKALIALLKAKKPEQFKDRIDVTSNGHSLVKLVDKEAWDAV